MKYSQAFRTLVLAPFFFLRLCCTVSVSQLLFALGFFPPPQMSAQSSFSQRHSFTQNDLYCDRIVQNLLAGIVGSQGHLCFH